jgi:hypothetical protein
MTFLVYRYILIYFCFPFEATCIVQIRFFSCGIIANEGYVCYDAIVFRQGISSCRQS